MDLPNELPVVCSLEAADLEQRLASIAALGAAGLIEREVDEGRHLLRFRSEPQIRKRLEAIVAAERECCAFLDLSLKEDGEHLVLSIAAPPAGQPTAGGLASAFAAED